MIKLTIEIVEKSEDESSVTLKTQKDLSKASKQEKSTASVVYNTIAEALQKLN